MVTASLIIRARFPRYEKFQAPGGRGGGGLRLLIILYQVRLDTFFSFLFKTFQARLVESYSEKKDLTDTTRFFPSR